MFFNFVEMLINITGLKDGEHNYNFSESSSGYELNELSFDSNIDSEVKLYKSHNQLSVNVNLDTKLVFQCDRCLKDFTYDLKTDFEIVYQYSFDKIEIDSQDESTEDLIYISPDTGFIDLKNEVRDFILLSVPMKKIPTEKDGICLFCNRNIDDLLNVKKEDEINPVWEKLISKKNK